MKRPLCSILVALFGLAAVVHADPKPIDQIVELLRSAETSDKPLPILEKAKAILKDYKAAPAMAGNARKKGAVRAEAGDRKQDAMERVNEAIEEAKAGRSAKNKITAAISNVRHLGAMRD